MSENNKTFRKSTYKYNKSNYSYTVNTLGSSSEIISLVLSRMC